MNILSRLTYRIRAARIDLLRADIYDRQRLIRKLEAKQSAVEPLRLARSVAMATRTRPPVPAFLRKAP